MLIISVEIMKTMDERETQKFCCSKFFRCFFHLCFICCFHFSEHPAFDNNSFSQYHPSDIWGTKINSQRKVISSCFKDYKTMLYYFFIRNTYMGHHADIWFEIITPWCIKRIQKKNKHCKRKTYLVKGIIATKSIHH